MSSVSLSLYLSMFTVAQALTSLQAEHIKYAPKYVHQDIAYLLNEVAETGTYPIELKHGLMIPIQKPGKQKWKVENIRPVILLSIL